MSSAPLTSASPCIGLYPRLEGLGGPSSFNQKFITGMTARGIRITADLDDPAAQVILVNGGSRRLDLLFQAHRRGKRIVQRLDGINWVQRKRWLGARHFLRAEIINGLLATIRRSLADAIVYQSEFSRDWWQRIYGPLEKPSSVVYNAVDPRAYPVQTADDLPGDHLRLIAVEGRWGVPNTLALVNALNFAAALAARLPANRRLEFWVVGEVPAELRRADLPGVDLRWLGVVPRERIPELDRSAHLFFSAELMAPCPNAVIEALACGVPVLAYDTGSLAELVRGGAGRVAPYGTDPWSLAPADPRRLVEETLALLPDLPAASHAARERAQTAFNLETMLDGYSAALFGGG